jgi:hypothetical protein
MIFLPLGDPQPEHLDLEGLHFVFEACDFMGLRDYRLSQLKHGLLFDQVIN